MRPYRRKPIEAGTLRRRRLPAALCFAFAFIWIIAGPSSAAPKRLQNANPGDCAACHGAEKVLPSSHDETMEMTWEECKTCHDTKESTLRGKVPVRHVHQLNGITCLKCHGKVKEPSPLKSAQCVACHGSPERLAEKTLNVKPSNPHTSPHYGTTLDCNLCHLQHGKSENFCSQCHDFNFVVP